MWLTIAIAAALFAGMLAILWFGYQDREQQREDEADAILANAPAVQPGHCLLCGAPVRRVATTDQALFEVEHRIDAELEEIVAILQKQSGAGRVRDDALRLLYRA
jgi:G:T/U-mismatch repair DNA glycosylase